jgi:hypothetical protein
MKKLLILVFFVFIFYVIFVKHVSAAILFEDDFEEGNANKWMVIGSSGWSVVNGEYGIYLNPGVSNSVPIDSLWNYNWKDYIYKVDMRGVYGTDKNIIFKFNDTQNFYEIHHSMGDIYFEKEIKGVRYGLASIHYPLENGPIYHFKIQIIGKHFKISVNDGTKETIIFDVDDYEPSLEFGKIGLRVGTGAISPSEVWFDNILVCDSEPCEPTPTITPTPTPLPVPYLSQKLEPWGSEEYNQASLWAPTQPTISRWGCALTSGAMTLLYHGINRIPGGENLNPGSLNNWLKSQTDGYLREGHLNWYALTRLSKIMHGEISSPILEFRRSGKDFSLLDNDLVNNHPPILEVPGHFIVSTGKTNGSYFINDPAWSEKTTLEAYNNDFISMRRLLPTSTNLSALLFVVDPHVNLTLTDQNGNPQGEFYFEGPLTDDISGEIGGKGINILNYNQPPEGEYTISVTASTSASFNLDIYSYDQEANPTTKSFFGFTNPNNPATFSLIEKEGGESENIQRTSTFSRTKQDILESQKSGMITKIGIAKVLLTKINRAEKLKNKGKINETKIILNDFLRELEIYFKKGFIKPKAYLLLKEDVEYLLSTL